MKITNGTLLYRKLLQQGYVPVPVAPNTKYPGTYDPTSQTWEGMRGWQQYADTSPSSQVLAKWESVSAVPPPGVGLLTGATLTALAAVDLDTTHEKLANAALQAAKDTLGATPLIRIGQAPKALLLYKVEKPLLKFRSARFELDGAIHQVEVLGKGQQFVAFGIHPGTGQPYTWQDGSPLDIKAADLPLTTLEKLHEFKETFEFIAQDIYDATLIGRSSALVEGHKPTDLVDRRGLIVSALNSLPDELSDDYHQWVRVGMALKAAIPDDEGHALDLWHEFSAKSDKYDPSAADTKWNSFHPDRIGAGTLYHIAREEGNWSEIPPTDAADEFEPVDLSDTGNPVSGETKGQPKNERPRLYYKKPSDISPDLNRVSLVEDLLDQGAMSVLYGESNTGKTFVAMDIAFHISTGRPWDGKRTQAGAVLYIAAEGGKSAENRIEALKRTYEAADFPLFLVPCSVDLLRPDADTKAVIDLIRQAQAQEKCHISMIVIDTLSRALAGGNENDSKDMGAFVRNIDAIRTAANAHLMVVHHSGKDKAKGARGHSLLRAATDTEIEIADKTLRATKQRDMEMGAAVSFELKRVQLGQNAYGKDISSCVVQIVDAALKAEFDTDYTLEPRDAVALNALKDCLANGVPAVEQSAWADACRVFDLNRVPGCQPWPEVRNSFNISFQRARERLAALGYVTEVRPKHWREAGKKPVENSQ